MAESPVSFDCKVTQIVQLHGVDRVPVETWLVLGEVVGIHIARRLIDARGVYDTTAAEPILRGGGPADYIAITAAQRFEMHRPK